VSWVVTPRVTVGSACDRKEKDDGPAERDLSGGAFSIDVHNVLADGDLVVTLTTVKARRNGVAASFPEVHVWRLRNGKAVEFREYQGDEQREDRFWS